MSKEHKIHISDKGSGFMGSNLSAEVVNVINDHSPVDGRGDSPF